MAVASLSNVITTIADLKEHLQAAVALELATIPPYLCGWWSIKDSSHPCATLVQSVVIDEMKHMTIVSNCLIAIGGRPDIIAAAPSYPSYLPDGETEFKVSLLPFGLDFLQQAMKIEAPKPRGILGSTHANRSSSAHPAMLGMGHRYVTIGEFYQAIIDGISNLVNSLGEEEVFPNGGDVPNQVKAFHAAIPDSKTAITLLTAIVSEGEGEAQSYIWDERGKLAHFYAFDEMARGHRYQQGDQPGAPTGPTLMLPAEVYLMTRDPKMAEYPDGSSVFKAAAAFNAEYSKLLEQLQSAFNGHPTEINTAVEQMGLLSVRAVAVLADQIPGKPGVVPGPTFEL